MWIKWLLTFLIALPAWGYNLTQDFANGFYWASLPIKLVVEDSNSSRKATLLRLATESINEWESRTGLALWDLTTSGTSNIIRWSENFKAETNMDPGSVLAVAIRYTNGPYFARSEIVINGQHYLNQDINHLKTTIIHELGHTMGLDHSNHGQAIMAPTLQDPYTGIHQDDVAGMTDAYAQTEDRQVTRYVSPLAYEQKTTSEGLSCATISPVAGSSAQAWFSMGVGILIGFVRRIFQWFKSLL